MGEYSEIDLKFSNDGDLTLGEPLLDEDGNEILNEHGRPIKDFKLTENTESLEQDIRNRVRTNSPEWKLHSSIGGNLEDIIGQKNTRKTAELGANKIMQTLTYDKRIARDDISIKPVPTAHDEVTFFLQILVDNKIKPLMIPIPFNFIRGMLD